MRRRAQQRREQNVLAVRAYDDEIGSESLASRRDFRERLAFDDHGIGPDAGLACNLIDEVVHVASHAGADIGFERAERGLKLVPCRGAPGRRDDVQ